jgi:hypothetical protein
LNQNGHCLAAEGDCLPVEHNCSDVEGALPAVKGDRLNAMVIASQSMTIVWM